MWERNEKREPTKAYVATTSKETKGLPVYGKEK